MFTECPVFYRVYSSETELSPGKKKKMIPVRRKDHIVVQEKK